jgi:toxin ParE1/3/4
VTVWAVNLTKQADQDVADILAWTEAHFGRQQAGDYLELITAAVESLLQGPESIGNQRRDDILPGLRLIHVGRGSRRGRHYLVFTVDADNLTIDVLRVLHDSMDLPRHVDPGDP